MTEPQATEMADEIIEKVLTHQANVIGPHTFSDETSSRSAAKGLAAFRQQLIEELKKQPQ